MPLYRASHITSYGHHSAVTSTWQSLHLQPRSEAAQRCDSFELEIAPRPADLAGRFDYFGNSQHIFTLREPHTDLRITSRSVVAREAPVLPLAGRTPTLAEIPDLVAAAVSKQDFGLEQFCHPTAWVPWLPEVRMLTGELTSDLDPSRTPVMDWLAVLGGRFREAFTYDPKATRVSTPLSEVMVTRRGVCQDFAHLLISCLRQKGLPAGYVSGYLLTAPPPGRPRLQGADASHAWISVYIPGTGWIDYDPTNACFVAAGHIVTARGRDYSDVSPVKGLFSGGGGQTLNTGVTVELITLGSVSPPPSSP